LSRLGALDIGLCRPPPLGMCLGGEPAPAMAVLPAVAEDESCCSPPTGSGDGSLRNVGIATEGTFRCLLCCQRFFCDGTRKCHQKFIHVSTQWGGAPGVQAALLQEADLKYFHPTDPLEPLPKGKFALVKRLATGINGDIFLYNYDSEGPAQPRKVVVKQLKASRLEKLRSAERSERKVHMTLASRNAEDALAEVGIMRYLAEREDLPLYLLRLEEAFSHRGDIWLVSEYAEGGELLAKVQQQGHLPPAQASTYAWQLLQAVAYLHEHGIGHRDISLENILLKKDTLRLMDFGMAVRSASEAGTAFRYFRGVGKDFYRAPECYVPQEAQVEVVAPAGARPGEVRMLNLCGRHDGKYLCEVRLPASAEPARRCRAEVVGYTACPADVWAVGVCVFVMLFGAPAWAKATPTDELFKFVQARGLRELLRQWGRAPLPEEAQQLVEQATRLHPVDRPGAAECLSASWFAATSALAVPCHPSADPMCNAAAGGA